MKKDILSIYCPSCGAPAEFDIIHQIYHCGYCGSKVKLEDAKQEKELYQKDIRHKVGRDVKKYPLMKSSCSGCGAQLVFEENEALATCDFCGNKLVRKKYTQTGEVPEAIVPFAVTKKEAEQLLRDWCEKNKKKREAKHLLEKIDELRGYYLPYHMARGPVYCDVKKNYELNHFKASGYLHGEFVNCSKQLDNLVLDAMEPYDLTELKEFDYAYVAGQRVKITDISPEDAKERLQSEVESNYRVFMEKIWGTKAIDMETKVDTVLDSPVLLPVYYIKEGEVSAAVNGQTGKVSVRAEKTSIYISLPWWLDALFVFLCTSGATFGIGYLASGLLEETLAITGILAVFYLFLFCFMFEPGLDNFGSITRYRNIFTSGELNFRREKGRLVPREEVLKRKIAEPVFIKEKQGKKVPVTYVFRSPKRIISMVLLTVGIVFLPVILALFVNGFNFARLNLLGSGVWFCITVPTAPIVLIQCGFKELYNNPWVFTVSEDGKKKRFHEKDMNVISFIKEYAIILLHPLSWIVIAVMGVMVYLTAFGF